MLTGTSNAANFGISPGNTFTERQMDDALVKALNAGGGLAGRRINPVYAQTDTGSASWTADFQAACATFTQDNHVEAVIGYVFDYVPAFEQCLASRSVPHLNTGFNVPDEQELRAYPLEKNLDVPTVGRRTLTRLDGALSRGLISSSSRLGFLMDTCPGTERSFSQEVMPFVASRRLTVTKTQTYPCAQGNSDLGGAAAGVQNAILAFASAGVNVVVIHGVSEAGPTLLFAEDAESQNYHPMYLVTSLAQVAALGSHIPAAQAANIHVFGWLATQDVGPSDYPKANASQARCLDLLRSQGLVPSSATDFYGAFSMCEAFFLYQQGLIATGGDSTGTHLIGALDQLGTSFLSSTNYGGGSHYARGVPDAVLEQRPLDFVSSCSCWRYVAATRPIPAADAR
ncbi:MAG: hypothetical protein M3N21_03470 [Actinomycetota bacterium]|nr:hypothetical protein [Actinomycetota bacterium]